MFASFSTLLVFFALKESPSPNVALFIRQIKRHCAEPFTEYWTCIDYSNLQLFRRCRKQQAKFDECVLDKLGWVRPDLGELSKVRWEWLVGRGPWGVAVGPPCRFVKWIIWEVIVHSPGGTAFGRKFLERALWLVQVWFWVIA